MNIRHCFFISLLLIFSYSLPAQRILIYCGKLIDTRSLQIQSDMTIVIEGKTISDVRNGYLVPTANDQVIDLKNRTIMPGLIDCHVHLEEQTSSDQVKEFRENIADIAFESTVYAKTTLLAGFTTVRDVGGLGINISLRNAIRKGIVVGPRIYTAGKI
ncbi:MAG TPA: amidohydrolase family protein, partial [Puia sp.]|nr:amidohydrolase family protein [Puia sp.]